MQGLPNVISAIEWDRTDLIREDPIRGPFGGIRDEYKRRRSSLWAAATDQPPPRPPLQRQPTPRPLQQSADQRAGAPWKKARVRALKNCVPGLPKKLPYL